MKLFFKNGNRTHGSRCYLLLLQNHAPGLTITWAASGCIYRLTLTASCILVDSLWLVPINVTPCHMMTTPQMTVKLKRSKGRRKNITVLTRVSLVHKHQWTTVITTVWSESTWGLHESSAANDSQSERSSNDGWHKDKSSISKVSFSTKIIYLTCTQLQLWGCSQNLCRPFLSCETLITYIT